MGPDQREPLAHGAVFLVTRSDPPSTVLDLPPRAAALCSPRAVAEVLRSHGLRPNRRLGQHFLVDRRALASIVSAAELAPGDGVLEIGAGLGTLTLALAARAGRVVSVEIARELAPALAETLRDAGNVRLVLGDALRLDLGRLLAEEGSVPRWKAVANLPYYVTAPLLARLLALPLELMVLTVQKEVAERLAASPGGKEYGALTLFVRYRAEAEVVLTVPPRAFFPPPQVESAVVRLCRRPAPPVASPPEALFAVVRAAFAHRRKTLANALAGALDPPADRARVEEALAAAGIPAARRPETLSLEEYASVADALVAGGWQPSLTASGDDPRSH